MRLHCQCTVFFLFSIYQHLQFLVRWKKMINEFTYCLLVYKCKRNHLTYNIGREKNIYYKQKCLLS